MFGFWQLLSTCFFVLLLCLVGLVGDVMVGCVGVIVRCCFEDLIVVGLLLVLLFVGWLFVTLWFGDLLGLFVRWFVSCLLGFVCCWLFIFY